MNQAKANHPELLKLNLKLQQLEYDRWLALQYLKPKLDLSYYKINQPFYPEGLSNDFKFNDNYKFGIDFFLPLFLRKERAKLAQARLKVNSTRYDLDLTSRQVINEIKSAHIQLVNNGIVLQQQRAMVASYYRLMNAEP